jgi:uncharacterized protein (TIGR02271 family)
MFGTPQGTTNAANSPAVGKTVYDANRAKVGMISAYNAQSGYFVAEKGMFFQHDLYIPLASVARSDGSGVYLNLTNEQLKADGYKAPPALGSVASESATNVSSADATKTNTGNAPAARNYDRVDTTGRDQPASAVGRQEGEDIIMPFREETLTANRTREQIGDVIVHRYIIQEDQTIEAPVTHKVISIEQVAARDVPVGNDTFTEKDVEVPLMGERLTLGNDTHVVVEVHIHKRLVTEQQHATGTVRREQISVKGDEQDATPRDALPRDQDRDVTAPRDAIPRDPDDMPDSENLR